MGLDARLKMARLHFVVDALADKNEFADLVDAALAGGVDMVQVRRGQVEATIFDERLEAARQIAYRYRHALLVVNDAEVAGRFKADVLHLGAADGASAPARRQLHQWGLLGRSTHTPEQVDAALADAGTQYLWVGPVFDANPNPPYPTPGLALVRDAAAKLAPSSVDGKPWFAVGGISAANLDDVLSAGARRIAVSSAIAKASDPEAAATELSDRLKVAWREDAAMQDYVHAVNASENRDFITPQQG